MPTSRSAHPQPGNIAPSRESQYGPLILAASGSVLVVAVALVLFVGSYLHAHPAVSNFIGGLLIALVVMLIVGAIVGVAAGARWAWGRAGTVKPDEHGIIPVPRKALRESGLDLQTLPNAQRTAFARATRIIPEGTHTVTQAFPHGRAEEVVDVVAPDAPKHTFAELVRDGKVGPGKPLAIGYDESDSLVTGSWEDFYSAGVGGTQGQGKSNTAAHFIAQVLIAGGTVYLADPHMRNRQSLTKRLASMIDLLAEPPSEDPGPIADLCRRIVDILSQRKSVGAEGPPLLLVIDEWTATLIDPNAKDAAKSISESLALITTQGRKFGIYALLLGQRWSAEAAGGTKVRNTLSATVVHRMRSDEARMLTGLIGSSVPRDLNTLRPGEAYVNTAQGDSMRLRFPQVDEAGIVELRRAVGATFTGAVTRAVQGPGSGRTGAVGELRTLPGPIGALAGTELGPDDNVIPMHGMAEDDPDLFTAPESERVWSMFLDGSLPHEIVWELRQVAKGSTRRYKKLSNAVLSVVRHRSLGMSAVAEVAVEELRKKWDREGEVQE